MVDKRHATRNTQHVTRNTFYAFAIALAALAISQLACGTCGALQKLRSTETVRVTDSPTPTLTPAAAATATLSPTSTYSPTPRQPELLPTNTPVPTNTPQPTHTPVPTNTPRPTHTPGPTSTPTPPGYIYEDDFSTDRDVWTTGEDADSVVQIQDGRLSLKVKTAHLIVWNSLNQDWSDLRVMVTAYPQPGVTGYDYGITFREQGSQSLYLARISVDGRYALHKYVAGTKTEIVPWTRSNAIQAAKNVLGLVCVGSKLNLYVNGTLVSTQEDDSLAHGDLGLYVGTGDSPGAEVQFDDFAAYVAQESDLVQVTPTPQYTWADYLYFDLLATQKDYQQIHSWYKTLDAGGSIPCPSQNYAAHRPNYVIPDKLTALRSIYDRYIAAINLIDGTGGEIGPLDRIQLLCKEKKDIGQSDMDFDLRKLEQAGPIFEALIKEVQTYR